MKALTLFVLPWLAASAAPIPYLAKVNDDTLTASDVQKEFTKRHGGHAKFLAGEPELRRFLDLVIDWRLLIQEAYRLELQGLPEIKQATSARLDRAAIDALLKQEIDAKAQPSEAEIQAAWERNTNELIQVRQIVLESKEKAETIRTELVAGASFETLVRENSIAPSRQIGGRMPMIGWGSMEPQWEEAVFKLAPNEFSPVIKTREGWQIVQFGSRSPLERPSLEKAHSKVEGILRQRALERRKREFSEFLWTKYNARATNFDRSAAGIEQALKQAPEAPVAAWEGGVLTTRDFVAQLDAKELAAILPALVPDEVDARLRAMVNEPLAVLEARARGLDKSPEVAEVARHLQEDLMESALYTGYVLKDVTVADGELRAYYDAHKSQFTTPEKRQVAHIVLATLADAQQARARIENGEPFEDLLPLSTDAQSAKAGGDLGLISRKDVPPEFEGVLTLKEGEVSAPIASKFGFHIVKVKEIAPEQPLEFEAAKGDIRKTLLQERQREARAAWVKKLRADAKLKINAAGIKAFLKQNAAEPLLQPPPAPSSHGQMTAPHEPAPPH